MKQIKRAVIGLGFGDEGKGVVVDYLCSKYPESLVVRYCGGPQSGHTVYLDSVNHVFSSFGSGTLRGVPTYWSKNCPISPIRLYNEYKVLIDKRVNPKLFINPDCPIITPFDVLYNKIIEKNNNHGSCLIGFGTTKERESEGFSLHYEDIFNDELFKIKLEKISIYYSFHDEKCLDEELEYFYQSIEFIKQFNDFNFRDYYYKNIIFEGSQGLMLDQDIGFFPHVTRDNVGLQNIKNEIIDETYIVTRAYQTRHGNGPMTNEGMSHYILENPYESNVYNEGQGQFRKSMLDLNLLKYAFDAEDNIKKNSKKLILVITCIDCLSDYLLTCGGKVEKYDTIKKFINRISAYLGIDKMLINNSPLSETIDE